MKRTLTLRRETLANLSVDDLAAVAGGDYPYSNEGITCRVLGCFPHDEIDPSPLTRLTLDYRYCYTTPYC